MKSALPGAKSTWTYSRLPFLVPSPSGRVQAKERNGRDTSKWSGRSHERGSGVFSIPCDKLPAVIVNYKLKARVSNRTNGSVCSSKCLGPRVSGPKLRCLPNTCWAGAKTAG